MGLRVRGRRSPSYWYVILQLARPAVLPAPADRMSTAHATLRADHRSSPLAARRQVLFRSGPLKATGVRPLSPHTSQFTERLTELGVAVCTVDDCLDGVVR